MCGSQVELFKADASRRYRLAAIQPVVQSSLTPQERISRDNQQAERLSAQFRRNRELQQANRAHYKKIETARVEGGLARRHAVNERAKEVAIECAAKAALALEEETRRLKQLYATKLAAKDN